MPSRRRRRTTRYEEFLEAIADPEHERHAEMHEWLGESFDPEDVDSAEISQASKQPADGAAR
jgi:hypothetical protein